MSHHEHARPAPVGGPLLNTTTFVAGTLIAILAALIIVRFIFGLGAVTNLNNGYPFGLWIVADVVIGSAFACGGFAMALLVYIFNKGQYHALVRPALLSSLMGYTLAGLAVVLDVGRYWNLWNMFWPWSVNLNSVMFEVAMCISIYVGVMWIEFSPVFMEKFGLAAAKKVLNKYMFFFIALGVVLPMMHQSSLGTLLIIAGGQVHPMWYTSALPLLFLLSCVIMGYAIVLFESCLAAAAYRRKIEMHLLTPLAKVALGVVVAYLLVRFGDLVMRGEMGRAFQFNLAAAAFWVETACFVVGLGLIASEEQRRNPARLFVAGILLMCGGAILRLNAFLITFDTGPGFQYFPSLTEILVTCGVFATEVMGYIVITRRFPVLPREA